nr:hypothetical protein [Tanacetum cinerariifolium]GEX47698.1 hypothetical protein [Tanacetum cinerariifolium]
MLNKENYVPWSSRLLRDVKSRPNGKLIHNSIINDPYVRRMIPELGDTNREVLVNETYHVQTDDELTKKELKQIKVDDQAIQTILLGLPEDIYAAFDSCETTQEIWLRVHQMMKGSGIGIQEKKANTSPRSTIIQSELHATTNAKSRRHHRSYNYIEHGTRSMAKAFKLNYSTPTNNNQRISSNPRNRQIAQPSMNMGQDRQMQMVGGNVENQFRQYAGHNVWNLNGYNAIQNVRNQNGNGNLVAARTEGNATGHDADLDEIKEVNANYILMANLQQASTSSTQTDKAPINESDRSSEVHNYKDCYDNDIFNMFTQEEQYTELLEPILESHQVPKNDNNVISEVTSIEQSGETVEQHPTNVEETRALYDSLY